MLGAGCPGQDSPGLSVNKFTGSLRVVMRASPPEPPPVIHCIYVSVGRLFIYSSSVRVGWFVRFTGLLLLLHIWPFIVKCCTSRDTKSVFFYLHTVESCGDILLFC